MQKSGFMRLSERLMGKEFEDCLGDYPMCCVLRRDDNKKCPDREICREKSISDNLDMLFGTQRLRVGTKMRE